MNRNEEFPVETINGAFEPENLSSRILFAFLMDLSGSMSQFLPLISKQLEKMYLALSRRPTERLRIELGIGAFGTNVVFHEFAPANFYLETKPFIEANGITSLGQALHELIRQTHRRKELLASHGIEWEKCICAIITDGDATDADVLQPLIPKLHELNRSKAIEFIPIAPDADCQESLRQIFGTDAIPNTVDFDLLFSAFMRSLSQWSQGGCSAPSATDALRREIDAVSRRKKLDAGTSSFPRLPAE